MFMVYEAEVDVIVICFSDIYRGKGVQVKCTEMREFRVQCMLAWPNVRYVFVLKPLSSNLSIIP